MTAALTKCVSARFREHSIIDLPQVNIWKSIQLTCSARQQHLGEPSAKYTISHAMLYLLSTLYLDAYAV